MIITGELQLLAAALGKAFKDAAVIEAMVIAGIPTTKESFNLGGTERTYYGAENHGVEFMFEQAVLESVIIHTRATERHGSYPRPNALIDGLPGDAPRSEVRALLGAPEWVSDDPTEEADQFAADGYFQHFIYADDRVERITIMFHDPAAW